MKKSITILSLGLALVAVCIGASERKTNHECVILWSYQDGNGNPYHYLGAKVYVSSSSKGAPTFPQGVVGEDGTSLVDTAEAIASLLDEGYHIQMQAPNGLTQVLVK